MLIVLLTLALPCAWYLGRATAPAVAAAEPPKDTQLAQVQPSIGPHTVSRASRRPSAAIAALSATPSATGRQIPTDSQPASTKSTHVPSTLAQAPDAARSAAIDKFLADQIEREKQGVFISPFAQAYDLVRGETADPNWSPEVEQALGNYVPQRDLHSISCGQNICEIVASAPAGADSDSRMNAFGDVMSNLRNGTALGDQFDFSQTLSLLFRNPDDRLIYVTYLVRK